MNLSDIWGARDTAEKPLLEPKPFFQEADLRQALEYVHNKIMALHDWYDTDVTMIDNERLRCTTGIQPNSWKAVLHCDIDWYEHRPIAVSRLCRVASRLMDISLEDWNDRNISKMSIFPGATFDERR